MSQNGKGSARRKEDSKAIAERWPDMSKKPKKVKKTKIIKKTSSEWLHSELFKGTIIHEPLGWDADDWEQDFLRDKLTQEEFEWKLIKSISTLSSSATKY